jgi:molecular chaperone GrpE
VHQALTARTDDLQRLAAEFENFRKRIRREQEEGVAHASRRVVEALLPVLDTLDSALGHEPKTPGEEALLAGMRSTRQQMLDALAREGVEVIPAEGEAFDPTVHEAVMGGGGGDLVVTAEMRRGYTMGGRVIRPAMVQVADEDEVRGEEG